MPDHRYYFREFLNLPGEEGGATIIAVIDDERNGELSITDCHRTVSLQFPTWHPNFVANTLHKARLLQRVVNEFVVRLEEEVENQD